MDYTHMQRLVARIEGSKYRLDRAESYEKGLKEIVRNRHDVILLDYTLGGYTGLELLRKAIKSGCQVPIIMVTGMGDRKMDLEAMKAGAADYLVKGSFDSMLLERAIRYALERNRAEKERVILEEQLRQAQKMETVGTLAGGIAHDFNNILGAMLGNVEMIMSDPAQSEANQRRLERTLKSGKRAAELIRQILTFSRQGGRERQAVKMRLLMRETLKMLRASIPANIEILENTETAGGSILCDPTQIHQVLMNLCTNAFHALKDQGGVLELCLKQMEVDAPFASLHANLVEGSYFRLSVTDTGCGIPPEAREHIFEPFFTTKPVGEGTGLGLSMVHGIVLGHGGEISLYSEPGKGTTFHVYLPVSEKEPETEAPPEEPLQGGNERILFVDDEESILMIAESVLLGLGYEVTLAKDGLKALELFRADPEKFDLAITDQAMPKMTGIQLLKELMKIRPNLPVVSVSGFSENISGENYREHGFKAFLMKPFLMRELNQVIRQALGASDE